MRPPTATPRLLLGDYLYAHGLVRVAEQQEVEAVADLAALISRCSQLRADGADGDGDAWAATAALLGQAPLTADRDAREAAGAAEVEQALALHRLRVG